MPKKRYTAKQLDSAKKRRSTTIKKLNDIADESRDLSHKMEKLRIEWFDCMDKIDVKSTKAELKKAEKPCKKIEKEIDKLKRKKNVLFEKGLKLEDKIIDIEEKYDISEDASF